MHKAINKSWHAGVLLLGLMIGLIHHIYVYPYIFHADSAAYQVLSSAMLDEKSILPFDFFYGNQLILLKISPFISLASIIGFSGYKAYAIGGAIAICLWFYICSLITSKYFESKITGLMLSTCLFIPLGHDDVDFLLGQESHLSNVVLSVLACLSCLMFVQKKKFYNAILFSAAIIIMAAESPIRAMIVIAPLSLFIVSVFKNKISLLAVFITFISLFFGALINKHLLLTHFPLRVDYASTAVLLDPTSVINNFILILQSILVQSSSSWVLVGHGALSLATPFYFIGFAYIILFISALVYGSCKYVSMISNTDIESLTNDKIKLLASLASIGFLSGLLLVASLNPDSGRHIFWATCLLKLVVFYFMHCVISNFIKNNILSSSVTVIIAILMSSWVPISYMNNFKSFNYTNIDKKSEINNKILSLTKQYGINYIYGEDFWRMQLLNSFDSSIKSSEIIEVNHEHLVPREWLSRPSWYCQSGDVLYYTKNGDTDKLVESKLKNTKSEILYDGLDGKVWKGPVLWGKPSWCK